LVQRWGSAIRGFKSASLLASYLLGLLWGLLPCGLVLTALLTAVASTNRVSRHVEHVCLWHCHHPKPVRRQMAASKSIPRFWSRSLASIVMMFFGFQFAMRGFASLGLIDHLMLGSVMLW
jgi:sulfite exporter TauE/SafE